MVKLPTRPENQIPHYSQDPLDSLRSEALLLRMAAGCLEWHWENTIPKDTNPPPLDDKTAKQLLGTVTFFLRQYYAASYGINNPFYDASSLNSSSQTSNRQQRNSESSTPLVTSVTSPASVSGKFISQERATPASTASPNVSLSKRFRKTSHTTPAALNETLSTSPDFSPHLRRLNAEIQKRKQHAFSDTVEKRSQEAILHDCLISCASIIRYISASRWEMILTRIRSKFSVQWSAVSSANNNTISQDDIPEMSEIHLLEFSHFDETRLSSILSELSISFGSLRKTAQPVIAVMLHDILERYMVENPKVFHSMYEDGKRRIFAGQPEALFDAIFSVGDTAKRRNSTWPTLSILLTLCPEIVMQIAMGGGDTRSPMLSKKVLFLDALRKAVRFSSSVSPGDNHSMTNDQNIIGAESRLALICYAEICTAASYSKPIQGRPLPPLWILAEEMEMEIKKRCLDVTRICYCQDGRIDKSLISSAIIAIGRLSFDTLKKDIIPSFLHPRTALQTQIATLTALHSLLNGSGIDETSLIEASCIPLTKLLHQTVTSTFGTSANGMRTLHTTSARSLQIMGDFESERNQVIMAILQIFLSKPYMILHQPDGSSQLDLKQRSLQPVNELVEFHPFDTGQLLAIFACLMHDDNHILVQSAVKDLFLLLMNTQTSVKAASDDDTSAGDTLQRDQAGFLYPHLNVIALALVRPCMAPQDPEHVDKIPYKAFLRFLKQLECTQSLQEGISKNVEIVLHLCEFIGLSILPLADENLRDLAAEILQAGALIAQAAQNTSSSMIELGKAIKNDKTPAVKGHMAQMERSLKVASAVDKCSPALPLVWFQLYGQWKRLAEAYGVVEVDTQAERTVGGIEMSFMQLLTPNEVSCQALGNLKRHILTCHHRKIRSH